MKSDGYNFTQAKTESNIFLSILGLKLFKKSKNETHVGLVFHLAKQLKIKIFVEQIKDKDARKIIRNWLNGARTKEQFILIFYDVLRSYLQDRQRRHLRNIVSPSMLNEESICVISNLPSDKFYATPEWSRLRYSVLVDRGNSCECCGRSPKNGVVIHVDHVKPRSIFPEYALSKENLQVLCDQCNIAKSNTDQTDWRTFR